MVKMVLTVIPEQQVHKAIPEQLVHKVQLVLVEMAL